MAQDEPTPSGLPYPGAGAMTPAERAEFERRRRGRNWAILAVLVVLVAIFYAISTARLLRG